MLRTYSIFSGPLILAPYFNFIVPLALWLLPIEQLQRCETKRMNGTFYSRMAVSSMRFYTLDELDQYPAPHEIDWNIIDNLGGKKKHMAFTKKSNQKQEHHYPLYRSLLTKLEESDRKLTSRNSWLDRSTLKWQYVQATILRTSDIPTRRKRNNSFHEFSKRRSNYDPFLLAIVLQNNRNLGLTSQCKYNIFICKDNYTGLTDHSSKRLPAT